MKFPPFAPRLPLLLAGIAAAFALGTAAPAMNKAELVDAIAKDAGLSKADSKRALEGFIAATEGALKKGDKVSLIGFGTWSVSKRAARTGRNPQTGKEIKIAAKNVVKFKAGADLSKKVNIAPPGGGGDDGTGEVLKFAGEIPPGFAEFAESFFARTAPDLGAEFLAALAEQGASLGEIDAFDSASIDGEDGIACNLIVALEEQGLRRSTAIPFLDSLVVVINSTLATGEGVEIDGFGVFGIEDLPDGRILATFEPEFDLGLSIILAIHDQIFGRANRELVHIIQQSHRVRFEVILATRSRRFSHTDFDGAQRYRNLDTSAGELVLLGEEFGDERLASRFDQIRDLVNEAEGDFTKFYEKGNKAAGTRVRKTMQELKNLAQDIRKEVQDIKNNG